MNHFFQYALFACFSLLVFAGCSDDVQPQSGGLRIEFDNVVGDKNLVLNAVTYKNAAGEDFTVSKLNYFVSNFVLHRPDGSSYTIPQDSSYFLIKEDTKTTQFVNLRNIPLGEYTEVSFMIGIDSLRNTMPLEKQKGVLDQGGGMAGDGMYWSWNSGYIFVKLEGTSPSTPASNNKFYYHIGLFGGYERPTVNNTRIARVKFGNDIARVTDGKVPEVHLLVDVLKFFDGPGTKLSISALPSIMGSLEAESQKVANNYAQMFTYDHVH